MDQIEIETLPGNHEGIRILRLSGPFTLQGVMEFQTIFRSITDPVLLIDLSDVPYMDSAALGAIISVHTSTQRSQRRYALTGMSDRLRTLMEVAGVASILVAYPSVAQAENALGSKAASI